MAHQAQEQRGHLLALAREILSCRITRARVNSRIAAWRASGIHTLVSSPARRSLAKPLGIAPIGLHPIAGLLRNERWCNDDAGVTEALNEPLQTP